MTYTISYHRDGYLVFWSTRTESQRWVKGGAAFTVWGAKRAAQKAARRDAKDQVRGLRDQGLYEYEVPRAG